MLSQLETGKLIPTLPTLMRIATVFETELEHFFTDRYRPRTFSVVRAGERTRLSEDPKSAIPGYPFEALAAGKSISAYVAEFPPVETETHVHTHAGAEFIYVLEGLLAINYQSEEHVLFAGDTVYFDGEESHSYHGRSERPARAIIVVAIPQAS